MNDDWIILEPELRELLVSQQPRRKGIYRHQIGNDLGSLKMIFFFGTILAFIGMGLHQKILSLLLVGVAILTAYFYMLHKVTYDYINSPVIEAKITDIGHEHPVMQDMNITQARTHDGVILPVSIVTQPAKDLLEKYDALQIQVLHCMRSETSLVLAVKAA